MSQLVVAIGWFLVLAAGTALIGAIVWQIEPRPVDKGGAGATPPAHH
jgi:hypothetical protein